MTTVFPWDEYPNYCISSDYLAHDQSGIFKHAFVQQSLAELRSLRPETTALRKLGCSFEGRRISLVTVGGGPRKVLLWSQMHGDEPTHTAVLLDLLNLLQRAPQHPFAQAILNSCTLHMIALLNPDGAEQQSRFNAQGIDINRDARQLQSPEGRILRAAVDDLQPDFAFNLHNQNARTTVGPDSQLAAVSLLVPSIDSLATETEQMRLAKRLASCFCQAVKDRCPGMISRYDAEYMPRAFGEAIQAAGVSTLLVEAGGWPQTNTNQPQINPITQLHFIGLVSTLHALATDNFQTVDPTIYEHLLRSNEHRQFDLLIRSASIENGLAHESFVADLGINQIEGNGFHAEIVELGDLSITTGKQVIDARGKMCRPGHTLVDPQTTPLHLPTLDQCSEHLREGITSLVGVVDLADETQVERFIALESYPERPINLGFVGSCARLSSHLSDTRLDPLLKSISAGLLGVLSDELPDDARKYANWFKVPLVAGSPGGGCDVLSPSFLPNRGIIQRGAAADLLLFSQAGDLRSAIVGGIVVFDDGQITGEGEKVKHLLRRT